MLALLALLSDPAAAQTFIDFDNLTPGCNFAGENPLRGAYQALGVTFEGPGPNDGGAVLDECGNFGVSGHSSPNFLAFNDFVAMANGGMANQPETMVFDPPASTVTFLAGSSFGGTLIATAYDLGGVQLDQDVVAIGAALTPVTVTAPAIHEVVFDIVADYFVVDDLYFEAQADQDGDGFESGLGGDCNDGNAYVHPGAIEICDGEDTDCDGVMGVGEEDLDGDGVGTCLGDCDDYDAARFPGSPELCDGGIDNDCDATTTEYADLDVDGYTACTGDCDDLEAAVHPGALEVCDGLDNDCDPATNENADPDGDGVPACSDICPAGNDTADLDGDTVPNACDPCPMDSPDDSDQDGSCDEDDRCPGYDDTLDGDADGAPDDCDNCVDVENPGQADEDGDGAGAQCDCDDADADVRPGLPESCNATDDDCDGDIDEDAIDGGSFFADEDGDGDGDPAAEVSSCEAPEDYVYRSTDCDDANAAVNGTALEICDAIDNNCDGSVDEGLVGCATSSTAKPVGGCACDASGSPVGLAWCAALLAVARQTRGWSRNQAQM